MKPVDCRLSLAASLILFAVLFSLSASPHTSARKLRKHSLIYSIPTPFAFNSRINSISILPLHYSEGNAIHDALPFSLRQKVPRPVSWHSSVYHLPTTFVSNARPEKLKEAMRVWRKSSGVRSKPSKSSESRVVQMPFRHAANGRSSKVYVLKGDKEKMRRKSEKRKINHWHSTREHQEDRRDSYNTVKQQWTGTP